MTDRQSTGEYSTDTRTQKLVESATRSEHIYIKKFTVYVGWFIAEHRGNNIPPPLIWNKSNFYSR